MTEENKEEKDNVLLMIGIVAFLLIISYWFMEGDTDGLCTPKVTKEHPCVNVETDGVLQHICFK